MFGREYQQIPPGLDRMEPGLILASYLFHIDVERVSPHDRIVVLRAHDKMASYYEAHRYRDMTAVVDGMDDEDPRWAAESAAAEIRAGLRLTRTASDAELAFALGLRHRFPAVLEALAAGRIDIRRAKTIARCTAGVSDAVARWVVERVLDHAPNLTTGQLKARIERLCMEAEPDAAQDRYARSVEERRVVVEATPEGTANVLGLELPPHRATAASRRINHLARSLNTKGETRTMDQLRADVFLDLLQGTSDSAGGGVVHLQADLDSLAALAEHPGELNGYGPVISDIARQVADELDDAEWRFRITDTASGETRHTGTTRRRPTTAQRRHIEERTPTCIFPGCRMPSVDCDLDHRKRWADGGATCDDNLHPLCRHDHPYKDRHGWRYRPLGNGDYLWTSRLGHQYTTSGLPP